MEEVLKYFSTTKKAVPSFYYYKQRSLPLMNFLFTDDEEDEVK
jgi:hypothetical protein